ncbi:helix-turn-helix protein [Georgenia soli]|uniref:Helix-turn-helix protein n=1 Tax=Georgenia soli TaxID=638953 RepID=A0A2A9F3J4_9MICO|nr:helix-turn-helix protein [Georgenia soli]
MATNSSSPVAIASAKLQRATETVLRSIAIDALALGAGMTLPKGDSYRERLGVGAGTVQQAFQILATAEALTTQSRGHLGRQIVESRIDRLWQIAELDPVRLVLPPRGPLEVRAMAEFSATSFRRLDIPYAIAHRRGASERIDAVRAGDADVAIVSSGVAAQLVGANDPDLEQLVHAEGTFYAPNRLLVLGGEGRRVAIDSNSWDQRRLTELEFPEEEGFEYVEVDFPRVPVEILRGNVDVGIWHEMQTLISPTLAGLHVRQPRRAATHTMLEQSSAAVMLVSKARPELQSVLGSLHNRDFARRVSELTSLPDDSPELLDLFWTV